MKKYIISLVLLILFLVGGIVYYTRTPEAVIVDAKTGTRTVDFLLLTKLNIKQKRVYYRMKYEYHTIGNSGRAVKQDIYYTMRDALATSTESFIAEFPKIKEKVKLDFERDNKSLDRKVVEESIRIIDTVKQLACDDTFDVANGIMACYDGVDSIPFLVGK